MLNKIIQFSVRNRLIVLLGTLALIAYGLYDLKNLPIDAVPDITDNQVQIITTSPSLGAPDVERFITFPIEQANATIQGIKQIRSFSRFGLSVVTIVFNDNIDIYWARQQVAERLQQVQQQIPTSFGTPSMAPITTGLGEIYQYTVRAKPDYETKYSLIDLRTIQDWIVRRQLLGVEGVADVASFGGKLKQYEVAVSSQKLAASNISIQDVFDALEKQNQNTGGAYIEKGPSVLFIRSEGLVESITDIENICIKNLADGSPVHIKDVAEVTIGHAIRYGALTYNGESEVTGAVVMMLKGANSSEVIKKVKERIEVIKKGLPDGIILEPFLDRTKMVNNSIQTVSNNLLEGALIIVFVLVLFLGNIRAGFIVASVIPLALLFAIILMNIFGVSGNLMSLGALDFGLIIDGAVIIVEAVLHRFASPELLNRSSGLSKLDLQTEVEKSAGKMMNSAVFGQLIILIVYLPVLSLHGIEGKMFRPMAQTVSFALIGAFILSLTYVPMMSAWLLKINKTNSISFTDKWMLKLQASYQKSLRTIINKSKWLLIGVATLFVISIFTIASLGGEFIPELPEGDFAVDTRLLPGSNLNTTVEQVLKAETLLLQHFPEIEQVVGKTGSSEIPTDPMPIEASDMMIILKHRSEWTSAKSYEELAAKMKEVLQQVPGVTFSFQYPVAMRFNELMTGARQDVVCKIFGENLDTLTHYANLLGKLCKSVSGATDIYVEPVTGMPQLVIQYNRIAIANYGLTIDEINKAINTAFAGQATGMVYDGEKRFELVVRLKQDQRKSYSDVSELLIETPKGVFIPLHHLAAVKIINGINQIQREQAQRRIIVGFNVNDSDVETAVNELQSLTEKELKLPAGYFIKYGGSFENLKEAKNRLAIAVPVALLLIFILLYFAFHSVLHGILIYSAIPLSATGGIFALYFRDLPFSISAGVGFIALFGVAVLNGIVLLAEINRQIADKHNNALAAITFACTERLRPVLMTAAVASLGFLPMAISTGEGAEVQRPLATVVIGGLFISTLLTLYVLPSLYLLTYKRKSIINPSNLTVIVLMILLAKSNISKAQAPVYSINQCIDSAMKNNMQMRSETLQTEYKKWLSKTGFNIPKTNVGMEYGNINSSYQDNRLYITQNFAFPGLYQQQKNLGVAEWKVQLAQKMVVEQELKKEVRDIYMKLSVANYQTKILKEFDSIYQIFADKTKLTKSTGESNEMEYASALLQQSHIQNRLKEHLTQTRILQWQLQWLINAEQSIEADQTLLKLPVMVSDTGSSKNFAAIKLASEIAVAETKRLKTEYGKLFPEMMLGYFNMSMLGTGADDVRYESRNTRFNSFQVGLGIPLFFQSNRNYIKAQQTQLQIANYQVKIKQQEWMIQREQNTQEIKRAQELIQYFETQALPQASLITNGLTIQLQQGEINFITWTTMMNQVYQIKLDYIQALHVYNQAINQFLYLNNQ